MSLTKQDLAQRVGEASEGLTRQQASEAVSTVLNAIADELAGSGEVRLSGFGTFAVVERAAREARNPQTGETMTVPPRKNPKFKPAAALKKAVNGE